MALHTKTATPIQSRVAVAVFFFISGFGFSSFASRIPTLQQQLMLNEAQLGTALFALPLGLICTLPLTRYLLNRYSSRYVLLLGSVAYNVFLCALGYANNMWQLMGIFWLFGSSRNLMNISVNAQSIGVQALFPKSIVTTFHGIWSISGFIGGAIGGWMIGHDISPTIHFAMVGLLCFFAMAIFYKHTIPNDVKRTPETKKRFFQMPDKMLIKLGIIAFGCMTCEGIMFDWSSIYFQKVVHVSKHFITLGYVAFMCAAAIARFSGDWVINKIGIQKVLQWCSVFTIVGFAIAIFFPYIITATIGFICVGIGISCIVPLIMRLASLASTQSPGVAIASVSTISYFGFLFGPPAIGYIAQAANLQWAFGIGIVAGIGMLLLLSRVKV